MRTSKYITLACIFFCQTMLHASAGEDPALRLSPSETLKQYKDKAMEQLLLGDASQALDFYNKATNLASQEFGVNSAYVSDLYFEMGSIAFESNKFEPAQEYLSQAVRIKPSSPVTRVRLAELLLLRGNTDEAKRQAEIALRQQPNNLAARQVLALSYLRADNPAKATQAFAYLNAVLNNRSAPVPMPPVHTQEVKMPAAAAIILKPTTSTLVKVQPKANLAKKSKLDIQAKIPVSKSLTSIAKPQPKTQAQLPPATPLPKPKPKLQELKAKAQVKPPESKVKLVPRGGLVPPPPPIVPVFGGFVPPPPPSYTPGFQLKTEAKVKREPKPPSAEEKPTHLEPGGDESDFLLDWAADKGSKKRHN